MNLVIFDLETGGLDMTHPIIQIAAVAVDERMQEVGAFERKVLFNEPDADAEALKMNHYNREVWDRTGIALNQACREFAAWLEPYRTIRKQSKNGNEYTVARLAAFNSKFDEPRLSRSFKAAGVFLPADPRVLCILQAVMWQDATIYREELPSYKLSEVAMRMGVPTAGAHDALGDCRMAAGILRELIET